MNTTFSLSTLAALNPMQLLALGRLAAVYAAIEGVDATVSEPLMGSVALTIRTPRTELRLAPTGAVTLLTWGVVDGATGSVRESLLLNDQGRSMSYEAQGPAGQLPADATAERKALLAAMGHDLDLLALLLELDPDE